MVERAPLKLSQFSRNVTFCPFTCGETVFLLMRDKKVSLRKMIYALKLISILDPKWSK